MTGILNVLLGMGFQFSPVTRAYTSSFTETIPFGALNVVIEVWGEGGGGGGDNNSSNVGHGGGGASGGYCRSLVAVGGHGGQTFSGTLQSGGALGTPGNSGLPNAGAQPATTVAAGTFSGSFTTMSALAGSGGINGIASSPGAGGQGGTASGGNQANTTGNNGTAGTTSSGGGGAGGPGLVGVNGTGNAGGTGGSNLALAINGGTSKVIFRYT